VETTRSVTQDRVKKPTRRKADGYSIAKRDDGRWEARITIGYNENGNPRRKSFYGETRASVLDQVQTYKHKVDSGAIVANGKETLLGVWLEEWLSTYIKPHREPKTYKFYEAYVRIHIKPALGKLQLRKLSPQAIQKLMNEKSEEGLSANFVRGLRATLRSALSQAWKIGLIEHNPAARVNCPKIEHKDPQFLAPGAVRQFLDAAQSSAMASLFQFALVTGLRVGEISGLRWSDIDFSKRTVAINYQLQRIDGKLTLKSLKSKSSRRVLPLGTSAIKALQDAKSEQLLKGWTNEGGFVFLNTSGRPLDPKNVDDHLKEAFEKAGLPRMSFHKLRHTAATLMVAAGVELHQVMLQLGHSQISLTANLYAHGVTESQRRASDILERVIERGTVLD
jgi:integrase